MTHTQAEIGFIPQGVVINGAVTGAFGYLFGRSARGGVGGSSNKKKLGRSLTADERAIYSEHFPKDVLDSANIYESKVPWWLRSDMDAITLGNKIYFRDGVYTPGTASGVEILGHELTHVEQYVNGMTYWSYIWESRHGYQNNKYEIEAYRKDNVIKDSFCATYIGAPGC